MYIKKMKILYAFAGSGVVFGILNYMKEEKKCVYNSWTTNFVPSVKWDSNWDRRESLKPKNITLKSNDDSNKENVTDDNKPRITATRNLILIRHGQYNVDAAKEKDRYLTTLGKLQADATGLRLKELNFNYSKIIHSTMIRAEETANIIHKHLTHLPIESCHLLCEGCPIPPEPPVGHWRPEAYQFFEDGARIEAAFRKYFHRADPNQQSDSFEIIVCHANVIRYFICRALQFPPEAWLRFSLHHCSLTWIAIRPSGRVVVSNIGDCGHLPLDKLSKF